MFIHRARDVGLLDHAEQIVNRNAHDAGIGAREKTKRRINVQITQMRMMQGLRQHANGMVSCFVAFARIDSERPLESEIMVGSPPRETRKIVGVERR